MCGRLGFESRGDVKDQPAAALDFGSIHSFELGADYLPHCAVRFEVESRDGQSRSRAAWKRRSIALLCLKNGVSALQLKRQTGLGYKPALSLMHRIRFAMSPGRWPRLDAVVNSNDLVEAQRFDRSCGLANFKGGQNDSLS